MLADNRNNIEVPLYGSYREIKSTILRAHFLSAEKYLQVAKNPTELAKLRAKEEALLTMFEK